MRKSLFVLTVAGWLAFAGIQAACAQEELAVMDNSSFDAPRKPPAVFDHDAHNEAAELDECNVCHHSYENGQLLEDESSEDMSCSECHELKGGQGKGPALRKAFHFRCRTCHEQEKKGPVMCGECHVRQR